LLVRASLTELDVGGRRYHAGQKRLRPFDDFRERLDRVMKRLDGTHRSDRSFHDFLAERSGGRRLAFDRRLARRYVEGFHGADPRLISATVLAESGSPGDDVQERRLGRTVEGYAAWTHDWQNDPYSRGAYSYQIVGGATAPAALARPLEGTLFFAGEATETSGATGTVHGAIASGKRAAAQVLRVLDVS
jgi:hypothetical protein